MAAILRGDVLGRLGGLAGQLLDLIGDHREAAPGLPGAGRFDRGVERQQISLFGNIANEPDHVADSIGARGQLIAQFVRRVRDLGDAIDHAAGLDRLLIDLVDGHAKLFRRVGNGPHIVRCRLRRQRNGARLSVRLAGDGRQSAGRRLHCGSMMRQRRHHRCHGAAKLLDDPVDGCHALALRYLLGAFALDELAAFQFTGSQHVERAGHLAHFVAGRDRGQRGVDVAGGEPSHGIADREQPPDEPPLHIERADARSGDNADQGDDQQQDPAAAKRFGQARGAALDAFLRGAYEVGDRLVEAALNRHVFINGRVGARCHKCLAGVTSENTVGADPERQKLGGDLVDVIVGERGRQLA